MCRQIKHKESSTKSLQKHISNASVYIPKGFLILSTQRQLSVVLFISNYPHSQEFEIVFTISTVDNANGNKKRLLPLLLHSSFFQTYKDIPMGSGNKTINFEKSPKVYAHAHERFTATSYHTKEPSSDTTKTILHPAN